MDGGGWSRTLQLILAIEGSFPIFSEGPEPDVLLGLVVVLLPVVAPATLGGSDVGPAQCPVDRSRLGAPGSARVHGCSLGAGCDVGVGRTGMFRDAAAPSLGGSHGSASAIALDVQFEDCGAVHEPVDCGERHRFVREDRAPFAEGLVGGEHGTLLVAITSNLSFGDWERTLD